MGYAKQVLRRSLIRDFRGLGHSSIKTTEIYLKRYEDSLLDKANKLTMKYVFEGVLKRFVSVKLFD